MIPPEALRVCPDSSPKPKTFDEILAESELPPPGPELYAARRRLWLTPRPEVAPTRLNVQSSSSPPSSSHRRLEILLSSPNAIQNEEVWNGGIQGVWKVLNGGRHFRRRLPMALLVCSVACLLHLV